MVTRYGIDGIGYYGPKRGTTNTTYIQNNFFGSNVNINYGNIFNGCGCGCNHNNFGYGMGNYYGGSCFGYGFVGGMYPPPYQHHHCDDGELSKTAKWSLGIASSLTGTILNLFTNKEV